MTRIWDRDPDHPPAQSVDVSSVDDDEGNLQKPVDAAHQLEAIKESL